jgi:hypothetical protein
MPLFRGITLICWLLCGACFIAPEPLLGADPSFEVTRNCRLELKHLKEATEKCMADGKPEFPMDVSTFQQIYTMFLTTRYLPKKPVPPTHDCEYSFMYKGEKSWDWFCHLHGLTSGDPDLRLTFPYHEYEFTAFFKKDYMGSEKYKKHYDGVMRWTSYSRTLAQSVKYNYSRNPTTTLIFVFIGLFMVWFIYKNLFD